MNSEIDDPSAYTGPSYEVDLVLKSPYWQAKQKYEYMNVAINITQLDPHGTTEIVTVMDKDSCKRIPQIKLTDGHLIVALRRQL